MTIDVAARLAAGRASAIDTQTYVSACHVVGYTHPDLTAHGAQILEWYGGEDGLDLRALDADCALLRAAAATADEALRVAQDGSAVLSSAWQGDSASAASEFVDRHCTAGAAVARALHTAADACEVLRDTLGRIVDEKVDAAVSINDRRAAQRPAWLAAAAGVTGGGAARDEAVGMVTQQIAPYVDADIRTEWLPAMRSATQSVTGAYEDALRRLNDVPATYFEVPGQLGAPSVSVPSSTPVYSAAEPATVTVPAAAASAPVAEAVPVSSPPLPDALPAQPLPSPALAEPPGALGAGAPVGAPGVPDVSGGMSGLMGQIADALGGLFDEIPEPAIDDDRPELEGAVEPGEENDETGDVVGADTEDPVPEENPVTEDVVTDEPQPVDDPAVTAPAPPPPEPPAAEPLAAEQPDEQTPCEIAADELAQVGQ
ncbi:hypothetical protein [Mycolicibacterium sarraceniae]|uniref:Uncharacterized protein n=1 Tax=Mycolicibacterium sarraceniae TaxID=1534348 RepID=A0A7I7SNS0_9MYCO|nr:hypothetical protein [Mycolicibacterium sarraceniae]BBY57486.1 hypothetical protein MSAR_06220 [Mycolicibacterium sarraceniae]